MCFGVLHFFISALFDGKQFNWICFFPFFGWKEETKNWSSHTHTPAAAWALDIHIWSVWSVCLNRRNVVISYFGVSCAHLKIAILTMNIQIVWITNNFFPLSLLFSFRRLCDWLLGCASIDHEICHNKSQYGSSHSRQTNRKPTESNNKWRNQSLKFFFVSSLSGRRHRQWKHMPRHRRLHDNRHRICEMIEKRTRMHQRYSVYILDPCVAFDRHIHTAWPHCNDRSNQLQPFPKWNHSNLSLLYSHRFGIGKISGECHSIRLRQTENNKLRNASTVHLQDKHNS